MYFEQDETVSVVGASAVICETGVEVGGTCYVKEKKKLYEGRIITYGECCVDVVKYLLGPN